MPHGTGVVISAGDHGARPYAIDPNHFALRAAGAALAEVYGVRPLLVRMGGTVPVCELFKRHMDLDTVFFSFSTADEDYHAPNEFFRINRLQEGMDDWARLFVGLSDTRHLSS